MYLQLQNRQGRERNWVSEKDFSSLPCMVCKAQHRCALAALLMVLTCMAAGLFGPDDSLGEAQKTHRIWIPLTTL